METLLIRRETVNREPVRLEGNLRVGDIYVDAIRVGLFDPEPKVYLGAIAKGGFARSEAGDRTGSTLSRDIDRFNHFSDGYLSWHPDQDNDRGCSLCSPSEFNLSTMGNRNRSG